MEASASHWFQQVVEDVETAEILLRARRFRYGVFFCHLALEKFLKGCVAERTGRTPPRSHDLVHLATVSGLTLPLEHGLFLEELTRHALEAGYPVGRVRFTRRLAQDCFNKMGEALRWLQQERTSPR